MQKISLLSLVIALLVVSAPACEKGSTGNSYLDQADCTGINTSENTYTKSIKAILDTECASSGCHDAITHEKDIDLSTYGKAKTAFQNEACLCSIHHGVECTSMPDGGGKLRNAIIKKIDCWAKNGYAE